MTSRIKPMYFAGIAATAMLLGCTSENSSDVLAPIDAAQQVEHRKEEPGSPGTDDTSRVLTRHMAQFKVLDEITRRTKVPKDRLNVHSVERLDKFWHTEKLGQEAVLLSGWDVFVFREPAMPGGHYLVRVLDDGQIRSFGHGK
jgi:hypothetical protein